MIRKKSIYKGIRLFRNIYLDLKFGKFIGGTIKSRYEEQGAFDVASTDYQAMPYLFQGIVSQQDVLVDVGCGKGRVINWWLDQGFKNRIIGVELDSDVAQQTRQRLMPHKNVEIICTNVLELKSLPGTLYYLFNPFSREVLIEFKHKLQANGRKVRIIYYNCISIDVFQDDPYWEIFILPLPDVEGFHAAALIESRFGES